MWCINCLDLLKRCKRNNRASYSFLLIQSSHPRIYIQPRIHPEIFLFLLEVVAKSRCCISEDRQKVNVIIDHSKWEPGSSRRMRAKVKLRFVKALWQSKTKYGRRQLSSEIQNSRVQNRKSTLKWLIIGDYVYTHVIINLTFCNNILLFLFLWFLSQIRKKQKFLKMRIINKNVFVAWVMWHATRSQVNLNDKMQVLFCIWSQRKVVLCHMRDTWIELTWSVTALGDSAAPCRPNESSDAHKLEEFVL